MKINLNEIEYSDNEMKEYLEGKGYKIESHKLPVTGLNTYIFHTNKELAIKDEMSISIDNEYKKVFEREIKSEIKSKILM